MDLTTTSNYEQSVLQFLLLGEGEPTDKNTGQVYVYADPIGIPTIGVGINLRTHLDIVLASLGFDVSGSYLTGAAAKQPLGTEPN